MIINLDDSFVEIKELPGYFVNRNGEIYSVKTRKLLKPYIENGYYRMSFHINGTQIRVFLHRILANVFLDLPSIYSELEVDHKDRNKLNNVVNSIEDTNLQVLTSEDHRIKSILERGQTVSVGKSKLCNQCGGPKYLSYDTTLCKPCFLNNNRKYSLEDKVIIEDLVIRHSWVYAAKEFNISDNGLRKRYISLGGDPKELTKLKLKYKKAGIA